MIVLGLVMLTVGAGCGFLLGAGVTAVIYDEPIHREFMAFADIELPLFIRRGE